MSMERQQIVKQLAGMRLAVGAGSWLTPRVSGKLFGLDASDNPQAPYIARLFGVRDAALGIGALSSSGEAQQQWLTLGLACDVADTAAGIFGGRGGYLGKTSAVLVTGAAIAAAAMGAAALRAPAGAGAPTSP
jgi:hypothetical protein